MVAADADVMAAETPISLGEPTVRRSDLDADYGFDVWAVVCTTCGYCWMGKEWESCPRCIEKHEKTHGRFDDYQPWNDATPAPPPGIEDDMSFDETLADMLIDWGEFWAQDHKAAEWLAEPVLAQGRSTALFAPGGTGKSLLALYMAACIATGRKLFGRPVEARNVLYLDYEMTADDLAERLEQMGFGDDCDLSRLHYALLPSLPGLDEPEGGRAVVRMAEMVEAELVVIDTFGRAVHGDENDADTVRSWYRWTGLHLKHDGRAFLRVDHAGKDTTKGQRGTSAKNDDVDVVWEMKVKEAGAFTLVAKKRRMGWVPLSVDLVMTETAELRFDLANGHVWPKGTAETAKTLDALGVPVECTVKAARESLKEAGHKVRHETLASAVKYRKEATSTYHFAGADPVDNPVTGSGNASGNAVADESGNASGNADAEIGITPGSDVGKRVGKRAVTPSEPMGNGVPPYKGNAVPGRSQQPEPDTTDLSEDELLAIANAEGF
jgi:hypothetical protein